MAPFSGKSLSEFRPEIIESQSRQYLIYDEINFPWTESHLSLVLDYVLKLEVVNSSAGNCTTLCFDEDRLGYEEIYAIMVASYKEDLRELFKVPKLQQSSIKKNELLAAFIDFLLQLLNHTTGSNDSIEDRIDGLKKELRFLLTILGDVSFLGADFEQVRNLLTEFEAVANDSGSLVRSFIADRLLESMRIDWALDALLEHIDILKANIIKFLKLQPFVVSPGMIPNTVSQDSLFIIDSFLYDLVDLLNRDDNLIVDVKDQIRTLYMKG